MIKYIIQKIVSIVKKLDDAKDPFEAGNLVKTREEIEYKTPPKLEIPLELISEILSYIEFFDKANLIDNDYNNAVSQKESFYHYIEEIINFNINIF